MILNAKPSAIAVLPTPGSPIKMGLFFLRRDKIWATRSISFSRPTIGSSLPFSAILVRSRPKLSKTGVLLFSVLFVPEEAELDPEDPPEPEEYKRLSSSLSSVSELDLGEFS